MINFFWIRQINIYRSGSVTPNAYNDYEKNWATPVLASSVMGWLGPESSQVEDNTNQEKSTGSMIAFFPPETDIRYDDIIYVDGLIGVGIKFQVYGDPILAYTPTGLHHIEAKVMRVYG